VPTPSTDIDLALAAELGQQLRVDSVRSSTSAGSGHPTSSMSAADLMAVLVSRHLRYDWDSPDDKASHYKLANLIAIVDVNRLGQRGPTDLGWDTGAYRRRAEAFGARTFVIDGHDVAAIDEVLARAGDLSGDQPTVILARTIKGKGFTEVEDAENWHGKPFPPDMAERAVTELGGERHLLVRGPRPSGGQPRLAAAERAGVKLPAYERGEKVATRRAYGEALAALGARPGVVAMDGEVSNSTFANLFAQAHPGRYFEMYIAEQQLVAAAVGVGVRGYRPFASTFAAFFTRAYDFIRMAAISRASICLCGSHAGVEIGADGPSQMALEDLAMMRAVHGSTVLYPSDATSTAALVQAMADLDGISYLRTTRGAYPVLYDAGEAFEAGGSKVLRAADGDQVTLIGAGVTLHACLAAADQLREDGISARVIDLYSVKPADAATLAEAAAATGGRLVIAEDHHPEGGLGAAVLDALTGAGRAELSVAHLAVRELPGSGTTGELLAEAGIDADGIARAARRLLA
jgi:transketolase